MSRHPDDKTGPDQNPLGLGSRGEQSNTGSSADTSYDAAGSDPYTTGEPKKDFGSGAAGASSPEDAALPSSDEP